MFGHVISIGGPIRKFVLSDILIIEWERERERIYWAPARSTYMQNNCANLCAKFQVQYKLNVRVCVCVEHKDKALETAIRSYE